MLLAKPSSPVFQELEGAIYVDKMNYQMTPIYTFLRTGIFYVKVTSPRIVSSTFIYLALSRQFPQGASFHLDHFTSSSAISSSQSWQRAVHLLEEFQAACRLTHVWWNVLPFVVAVEEPQGGTASYNAAISAACRHVITDV